MRTDVYHRKDASPSAGRLADFCRNLTPGLVLIDGNEGVPKFEFGFEIAARMVECESANRIEVWSWQSFLRLCGTWLTGDTLKQNHRWVIQGESLGGTRIEAWLEEPLKPRMEVDDPEWLQNGCRADWSSILDSGNDVVLLDFKATMYMLMDNGNDASSSPGSSASLYTKYDPKTFPVVSADRTKVWLVEIDGRQIPSGAWYSLGVKGYEMYRIAKKLGGAWVTGMDGGGSSATWVWDASKSSGSIVNKPCDSRGERSDMTYILVREK